ncbi:MAG: DUF29 domain-containing protein [Gomphosphaeria aponina SAG 52.96 = DSM 107014]|uniref:DUF29 domain-containing protein n=1 Tax=Gomphosphaeria aponina SAG 52.96 = DSM 107014 TaxID=1521640 RepID=A0A941JRI0_9CHRO|nr:DUF29 domain-containing protein [Gomphosphaeria aponina SAG 52.96 = DSM 107014]
MKTNLKLDMKTLYDQDFYQWINSTVKQIRERNFSEVDWENLLEELESLGKQQQQELENRLIVLFEHLLKYAYWLSEKEYNERGWKGTIREQRQQIKRLLKKNPSLKPYLLQVWAECYQDAREITLDKTGLSADIIPEQVFINQAEILDENFLPEL